MFECLRPYMLTKERGALPGAPRYSGPRTSAAPRRADTPPTDPAAGLEFFSPGGKDPLFWCFQIGRGECFDPELPESRGFQREQELKADAVEHLRKAVDATTAGARKKLAAAESELSARPFTRGHGLCALAKAYSVRLLYVSGRTCCRMGPEGGPVTAIIRRIGSRNSRRHEVLAGPEADKEATRIMADLWCIESWEKPIRSIGAYTVGVLRGMASKAGLAVTDAEGRPLRKAGLHAALISIARQN